MEAVSQWEATGKDALRGIGGGLVFGVPLLYTMEVWSLGRSAEASHAIIGLLATFVPVFLLVSGSGFRRGPARTPGDVVVDVVTAVGLGLLSVALVLALLQRITLATPGAVAAQIIVFEAAPFAIGAAVASEVFRRTPDQPLERRERSTMAGDPEDEEGARGTVWDIGATAVGATFIAGSIAPTDEVQLLAADIENGWLAVLVAASLAVTYALVFIAGFSDEKRRKEQVGVLQRPATETVVAYLVSLTISAGMLWFFGNLEATGPPIVALGHAVVLSFPASIGGAAGRIVL